MFAPLTPPFIGWRRHFPEDRPSLAVPVHAVQHQAGQMDVQVGRRPKALDQRDRAAVGLGAWVWSQNSRASSAARCSATRAVQQFSTKAWPCRVAAVESVQAAHHHAHDRFGRVEGWLPRIASAPGAKRGLAPRRKVLRNLQTEINQAHTPST